ncbi:MAG: hypothetical protein OEV66_10235 [Spirochaetia bacterium]|nr:hypothetical protein [Spirochaetia bacterium]
MNEQDIKELTSEYEKRLRDLAAKHSSTRPGLYELETTITEEFKDLQAEMLKRAHNRFADPVKKMSRL